VRLEWLQNRFKEGMKIKLLRPKGDTKPAGFIEYVPGEYAWRAIAANDYLVIHCIWMYPKKNQKRGYASKLVSECISDAKNQGKLGVAAVTSEGSFMAGKALFEKNGFQSVAEYKPFNLMVKQLKKGPFPSFTDWKSQLAQYVGLNIVYSEQCPWVVRSIKELSEVANRYNLKLTVVKMETAKDAQNAPSIYASFNLIYDGKLLADHYISRRRFENIIHKEMKSKE
jgi:hypothetical protein